MDSYKIIREDFIMAFRQQWLIVQIGNIEVVKSHMRQFDQVILCLSSCLKFYENGDCQEFPIPIDMYGREAVITDKKVFLKTDHDCTILLSQQLILDLLDDLPCCMLAALSMNPKETLCFHRLCDLYVKFMEEQNDIGMEVKLKFVNDVLQKGKIDFSIAIWYCLSAQETNFLLIMFPAIVAYANLIDVKAKQQ